MWEYACVLGQAWEILVALQWVFLMLFIQLILDISNQWSIRISFISDDKNDIKDAGFAQRNWCRLLKGMVSFLCFLIHLHCIFYSRIFPQWSYKRNSLPKPPGYPVKRYYGKKQK